MNRVEALAIEGLGEAERIAASYAPARLRPSYRALLAFDAVLGRIALAAREPLPAQLRLAWWREACARLPEAREHPVLAALAESWCADPGVLAALVDAWEEVAVGEGGFAAAAEAVARERANAIAACAGETGTPVLTSARCWTLAVLSNHAPLAAERAAMLHTTRTASAPRLPRSLRPLAVLAGLAQRSAGRGGGALLGDRMSPLAAMRLGIFGR